MRFESTVWPAVSGRGAIILANEPNVATVASANGGFGGWERVGTPLRGLLHVDTQPSLLVVGFRWLCCWLLRFGCSLQSRWTCDGSCGLLLALLFGVSTIPAVDGDGLVA
jgi:hypothetical protein